MKRSSLLLTVLILGLFARAALAVDLGLPVKEIGVAGAQRASENTIRFYIRSKIGEPYSVQTTREDIRRIYNLGYFDDVRLAVAEKDGGLSLTFEVKEKPFVRSVTLRGAKVVPDKDMQMLITMKKGTYFQKHLIKKDVAKIKKKYVIKGYYFTEVEVSVVEAAGNQVDVSYNIVEKQKVKIGKLVFRGNKFLKDHQLAGVIESKPSTFWEMFSDSGNYQREILKTDLLRMESYYREFGFIKARLEEPKVEVDREAGIIVITFTIHEGDQYFVGAITAQGDNVHSAAEIMEKMTLKQGEPFNQSQFRQNLFDVSELYMNDGYAYAAPIPDMQEHPDTKTVDVTVKVDPGKVIYIGRIAASGNFKTNDNVVRREIRLREGERFSGSKLKRSRERLQNTGFFSGVDIEQRSGHVPDTIDLGINIIERETGNIRAGMGYSSLENLMLNAQVTENNFFGTGRRLSLGLESSTLRQDYYLDFTEPRWQDRDILLGFSAFSRQFDYLTYISNSTGGSVSLGRGIGEYTNISLGYRNERIKVAVKASTDYTPSSYLLSQVGVRNPSSVSFSISHDRRDNTINPSEGWKVAQTAALAGGVLGGDVNWYKLSLDGSHYWKLPYEFIAMLHGNIKRVGSYGGRTLPLFEHYFMGGSYDLRGFNFSEVGPMDTNRQAIGGEATLLMNLEISYPFTKVVEGVVFYDRGQVYGSEGDLSKTTAQQYDLANMRHSAGWGLRITTPAMPIWLAWGFKLDQRPGEGPMEFHFSMAQGF